MLDKEWNCTKPTIIMIIRIVQNKILRGACDISQKPNHLLRSEHSNARKVLKQYA